MNGMKQDPRFLGLSSVFTFEVKGENALKAFPASLGPQIFQYTNRLPPTVNVSFEYARWGERLFSAIEEAAWCKMSYDNFNRFCEAFQNQENIRLDNISIGVGQTCVLGSCSLEVEIVPDLGTKDTYEIILTYIPGDF